MSFQLHEWDIHALSAAPGSGNRRTAAVTGMSRRRKSIRGRGPRGHPRPAKIKSSKSAPHYNDMNAASTP